jgi:hypothetical protein
LRRRRSGSGATFRGGWWCRRRDRSGGRSATRRRWQRLPPHSRQRLAKGWRARLCWRTRRSARALRTLVLKRGGLLRDRRRQRRRERRSRCRLRRPGGGRCSRPRLRRHGRSGLSRRRHRYRRRHSLGPTARIGNRHGVRNIVDDDRVVNVVVDHVVRRRRHVGRRTYPDRNRPIDRDRQQEKSNRWRRRCKHHKLRRRRSKENDRQRRRRRKREDRIIEDENRPLDIDDLFRRGRRQVIR